MFQNLYHRNCLEGAFPEGKILGVPLEDQRGPALGLTKEGKGNVQAHRPLSLSSQGLDRQPQAAPYIQMGLPTKRVEKGEKL